MWWFYGPWRWNFWFIPPVFMFLFILIIAFIFYQVLKRRDSRWPPEIESLKMEIKSLKDEVEKIKRHLGGAHGID